MSHVPGPSLEFYHAVSPLSSSTITLDGTLYHVFTGGHYAPADPVLQGLIGVHGARFDTHGECLTGTLMRYWKREQVPRIRGEERERFRQRWEGTGRIRELDEMEFRDRWIYVKRERDEGMEGLPRSFWLLQVRPAWEQGEGAS